MENFPYRNNNQSKMYCPLSPVNEFDCVGRFLNLDLKLGLNHRNLSKIQGRVEDRAREVRCYDIGQCKGRVIYCK